MSQTASKLSLFRSTGPSGQRIVQCPACQTKFAVSMSILESIETPRFHCSRCDHLFTLDGPSPLTTTSTPIAIPEPSSFSGPNTSSITASAKGPQIEYPEEAESPTSEIVTEIEPPPVVEEQDYQSTTETLSNNLSAAKEPEIFRAEPDLVDTFIGQSPVNESKIFEEPKPPAPNPKDTASKPAQIESESAWLNPLRLLRQKTGSHAKPASGTNSSESLDEALPAVSSTAILGAEGLNFKEDAQSSNSESKSPSSEKRVRGLRAIQVPLPFGGFSPRKTNSKPGDLGHNFTQVLTPWKSFFSVGVPCVALLLILGIAALCIRSLPPQAKERLAGLVPTTRKAAPSGLQVVNAKLRPMTLESGNIVNVLTGTVTNQSSQAVNDVLIEIGLYAKNGDNIETARWLLPHSLNSWDINSLTLAGMRELQSGELGTEYGKRTLKSGDSQPFNFALVGENNKLAEPAFFSARVHSVK